MVSSQTERRPILSRRATLATVMTLGAGPVLAGECQVGPPAHAKGPSVWLDMDQIELDASYDQSVYAPLQPQIAARRAANSELTRARLGQPLRRAYGPTDVEKLDIYKAKQPDAPIFLFIHGGAWLGGAAKNNADSAEMFVNAGITYIALDFIAIKEANGDLRIMADQIRRAIAWAYKNGREFGGDPNKLYVGGHSSGGHLCGVALITDWQKDFGLPQDFIKGAICASGMFDMRPVRLSRRSTYVRFDDDMELKMSALRHLDMLRTPVVVTSGSFETPDFQRQSREFAAAALAAGKTAKLIMAEGYNHFEMGESFSNPYGPNGRAALEMIVG
jgi:arylformamidase